MNDNIDVYNPGRDISGRAKTPVTGKRFLAIVGDRDRGNLSVGHAAAAGRVCGVSKYDSEAGQIVGVARGKDRVTYVAAGAAIAAFGEVEVGADGKAVPLDAGVAVGYAVTAAVADGDAEISLY